MPLDLNRFVKLRPYLYHLTARRNVAYIAEDRLLKSANVLYEEAGQTALRGNVRRGPRLLQIGNRSIHVRDQDRLHAGNITFSNGWDLRNFVEHLDQHVFFWPGSERGPISYGQNHFERYLNENPVILRIRTKELFGANGAAQPLFCRFNSGAPRCNAGKGSPRGPEVFAASSMFHTAAADVKEVTFLSRAILPPSTQMSGFPRFSWSTLIAPTS